MRTCVERDGPESAAAPLDQGALPAAARLKKPAQETREAGGTSRAGRAAGKMPIGSREFSVHRAEKHELIVHLRGVIMGSLIGRLSAITLAIVMSGFGQHATAADDPTLHACSVLTRAEVRKHVPWDDQMESIFPKEEEDRTASGSGCEYPSVRVQVMTTSPDHWKRWVDTVRNPTVERVAGVGDEAYIRDNKGRFAEFYAKRGGHLVSLQKSLKAGETMQTSKPQLAALAKAVLAKLPAKAQ